MRYQTLLVAAFMLGGCASSEQIATRKAAIEASKNEMRKARQAAAELTCSSKEQCDRMFRIASDVISEMSDMKIQTATNNYIATYNPIDYGRIGMVARRSLSEGNSEVIKFDVNCRGMSGEMPWEECYDRVAKVYQVYKSRIEKLN